VLYQLQNENAAIGCFISDNARKTRVFNSLKNDPCDEYFGEVVFKIKLSNPIKSKLKFM
jgi:hypothetical protein